VHYPPCIRFVEIELKHIHEHVLEQEAEWIMEHACAYATKHAPSLIILGPAKPPVSKVKNIHSRKIYIKGQQMQDIIKLYRSINHDAFESHIYFCPNPLS
jgi:primosomal protein N'